MARTLLEQLVRQGDRTIEEWCVVFDNTAQNLSERITLSSRQLQRWMAGQVDSARPAARRVAQEVWGHSFAQLLGDPGSLAVSGGIGAFSASGAALGQDRDRELLAASAARAHAFVLELSKSNVSGESMDQLYDDVAALSASYQRQAPLSIIAELVSAQESIFSLLEGRQRVPNTRQLLLLAGVTSGLLAKISHDFADPHAALTQSRTAFLCADNADHNGMRAWIRGLQSLITYWAGRYHDSVRYAQHGSEFAAQGTSSVWLAMCEARAWAALGNDGETMAAIQRAEARRESALQDEVDEFGGLCTFSCARQAYYAADALAWLPSLAKPAEDHAQRAVSAYGDTAAGDWAFGDAAGSATNLAIARLRRQEVEGAATALEPVFELPSQQRINGIVNSMNRVYSTLIATPVTAGARDLQERIEEFTATPLRVLGS